MSSTTNPGNRSAADIEADVEQTRMRVADTIVALRDSMSPGQIMDQVVDYARSSGGADFTRNLGAQVRDNPLPVVLIGAGIGWLLLSNGNRSASAHSAPQRMLPPPSASHDGPGMMERATQAGAHLRDNVHGTASSVGSTISGAASSAGSAASHAAGTVSGAIHDAGEAVSGMVGGMASAAGSARDSTRAYGHDASHAARQGFSAAAGSVNRLGQQTGQMSDHFRQSWQQASAEQPLLIGALGLALGAVVGALLPRTQTEDRLVGEASDNVAHQLGAAAQEGYAQAKEVVTEHATNLQEKMSGGDGTSASSLGDKVVETANEVRKTMSEAAHDLGNRAREKQDGEEAGLSADKPASPNSETPARSIVADDQPRRAL